MTPKPGRISVLVLVVAAVTSFGAALWSSYRLNATADRLQAATLDHEAETRRLTELEMQLRQRLAALPATAAAIAVNARTATPGAPGLDEAGDPGEGADARADAGNGGDGGDGPAPKKSTRAAKSRIDPDTWDGPVFASRRGKTFYAAPCSGYARIKEENLLRLDSVAEARARGLRPAKNCFANGYP